MAQKTDQFGLDQEFHDQKSKAERTERLNEIFQQLASFELTALKKYEIWKKGIEEFPEDQQLVEFAAIIFNLTVWELGKREGLQKAIDFVQAELEQDPHNQQFSIELIVLKNKMLRIERTLVESVIEHSGVRPGSLHG